MIRFLYSPYERGIVTASYVMLVAFTLVVEPSPEIAALVAAPVKVLFVWMGLRVATRLTNFWGELLLMIACALIGAWLGAALAGVVNALIAALS